MPNSPINVTIWNEFIHEQQNEVVKAIYPTGIHNTIKDALEKKLGDEVCVSTATLDQPKHGLTDEVLSKTEVLLWWGHCGHDKVEDAVVEKIQQRVLEGMGLIVLHSGHNSKIFKKMLGTQCSLKWREAGEREILWAVNPGHPIVQGLQKDHIDLPKTEMYGEHFDIPTPDELIFISWFEGGEVFRSGCTWTRGKGKIFYFRPGHETFPLYYNDEIQQVIANSVKWATTRQGSPYSSKCPNITEPLVSFESTHVVDNSLH